MITILHWLTGLILAIELPVPIYWFIIHGAVGFWRGRGRMPYLIAVAAAWGLGGWLLYRFLRLELFVFIRPVWAITAGAILLLSDVAIFAIAESELGGRRLVGQAELSGSGELAVRGLYQYVRHPRYLGMIFGVLGACFVSGSPRLWLVSAIWFLATLGMIAVEERELRTRFGPQHADYAKRVPALLPFRLRWHD